MSKRAKICRLLLIFIAHSCLLPAYSQDNPVPPAQNFHQWGAVTLFNGLPSDNVRAIAQTPDGIMWFGTDDGLAGFDGRRVQKIALESTETNKILALKISPDGALWIGKQNGAIRYRDGQFRKIEETKTFAVTAFLFGANTFLATDNGVILKLSEASENNFQVERIPEQNLKGNDEQSLKLTGLAQIGEMIVAATRSRSILLVENNQTFETFSRPRPFFVNALAQDGRGTVWLGADADNSGSGLFSLADLGRPQRIGTGIGNVLSVEPDPASGVWAGTQNNGLYHFRGELQLEHYTFENTAGGLRSNTIYALFIDREGVVWIGTNRGVSRFDASSPFNKILSEKSNSNFVRTLFKASDGRIYAGTNRGLFLFSEGNWIEADSTLR